MNSYEITINLIDGDTINDINYFSIFRTPLIKMSSYVMTRCSISTITAYKIINDIASNLFPKVEVNFYKITHDQDTDSQKRKVHLLTIKQYLILQLLVDNGEGEYGGIVNLNNQSCNVLMILVNPILYLMSNTITFNTIQENKKCLDVLNEFEGFIKNTYGDSFNFKKIFNNGQVNQHIYEQLFIKTINDLNIPSYIINNYKLFNTLSFYFFDDFVLKNNDKDIVCYLINFYNKNSFERVDVSKYFDVNLGMTPIRKIPIADYFQQIVNKEKESFVFKHSDIKFQVQKELQSKITKQSSQSIKEQSLTVDGNRNIKPTKTTHQVSQINQSTQYSNIYIPDTISNALNRYNDTRKLLTNICEYIFEYQISGNLIDYPQFGELYNLNTDNRSAYIYTPISIVNTFVRQSDKFVSLTLITRYLTLSFYI